VTFAVSEMVSDPRDRHFLVRAVPKGGLKGMTPSSGPVTWLTGVPGELGLLGLIINKVVYRGRWLVLASPIVRGEPVAATWSIEAKTMAEANRLAEDAIARIRAGTLLD
jgi:hypothetical protein